MSSVAYPAVWLRAETAETPSMEGTPVLRIVVGDEERLGLELDLDGMVREGARRMLVAALKAEVVALRGCATPLPTTNAIESTFVGGIKVEREDHRSAA